MMESEKKVVVKVAFFLFLMGFSASTVVAGRKLEPSFISQVLNNPKSSTKDCCKACVCTLEYPFGWCSCADVTESCLASCKSCICTDSIPPQCRCWDAAPIVCPVPACT